MLTLLRRIRKSLIESGSARKYLLYAIGEILLVMIGILLALQVNNWNEERKTGSKERAYLKRLLLDLSNDSQYFKRRINVSQTELDGYYKYIHESRNIQQSTEEFKNLTNKAAFSSEQLTIQNSTYIEMINAGNIDIIKNDSLKIAIIDLYREYEYVGKHIQEINLFSTGMLQSWTDEIFDIKYRKVASNLFDNPSFYDKSEWAWVNKPQSRQFLLAEQTVAFYFVKHELFINYFEQLIPKISSLVEMIMVELGESE